jgi:hypothetical protein
VALKFRSFRERAVETSQNNRLHNACSYWWECLLSTQSGHSAAGTEGRLSAHFGHLPPLVRDLEADVRHSHRLVSASTHCG